MAKDFYSVLGVTKKTSKAEIKSAYRKLALKWHPDKNKSADAEKKFKEINHAYEVLSNDKKRQTYDQLGHDTFVKTKGRGFGGFGGNASGGGAGGGQQGGSYQTGPFSWSYTSSGGGSPFGRGGGGGFSDPFEIFEQFFGGGFANAARRTQLQTYQISVDFMDTVSGAEKTVNIEGKTKTIKIPEGVKDGTRIRFSDFNLIINVKPDKLFQRKGQDVFVKVQVPFTKAILGGTTEVPTLNGKMLKIKIKTGTKPGTMLRLQGKGIKYPHTNKHGDQYIVFDVSFPKKLSRKQKGLIKEFEDAG